VVVASKQVSVIVVISWCRKAEGRTSEGRKRINPFEASGSDALEWNGTEESKANPTTEARGKVKETYEGQVDRCRAGKKSEKGRLTDRRVS
jgi:hypothetical protein